MLRFEFLSLWFNKIPEFPFLQNPFLVICFQLSFSNGNCSVCFKAGLFFLYKHYKTK